MKITATTTSTPLQDLLTIEQKTQIAEISKFKKDFIYALKVVGSGTLYVENNGTATTTDSYPRTQTDGILPIEAEGFSKIQVRSGSGTVDVRILPM